MPKNRIKNSIEMTDVKISFVSLVDKPANKRAFLITKGDDGKLNIAHVGRIIKRDDKNHYLTGIVYEPMVGDAHDNYMTEEEIEKAAHWFIKHGNNVDRQHDFEPLENVNVVESYLAPVDMEINGESVKKGTWLMTVEVVDKDIWKAVENGKITGFSMAGTGCFAEDDIDISGVNVSKTNSDEKKNIFKQLASALGFKVVEKGDFTDKYKTRNKSTMFWNAFDTLRELLSHYDYSKDRQFFEEDEKTIRDALQEFSVAITEVLATENVVKSIERTSDSELLKSNSKGREDMSLTREDVVSICKEVLASQATPPVEGVALESVVEKSLSTTELQAISKQVLENLKLDEAIGNAVTKAVEPILASCGLPSNLNDSDDGQGKLEKSDSLHYLHGII